MQSRLDLTYFIARGTDVSPHLMLWVDEGDQITAYAWSYLRQSFQRRQPGGVIRNCTPRADFLANLEPAEAGAHFGIGRDLYIIPAEYQPGHLEDRHISIRLRPTAALSATGAAITSGTTAIANWQKLNLRAASGVTRQLRYGNDGALEQSFECAGERWWRLGYIRGGQLVSLHLTAVEADQIDAIKQAFDALWDGFRQPG